MPMYGRRPSGRAGPRSTRTTRYSAKRRKGGLKRAATRTTRAPVATGYSRKGGLKTQYSMQQISDTCVRIVGRSYIGAVNNSNTTGNAIGLAFDINPSLLGDRVAVLSSTYDKYCYQSMKFTYVPQCPTSQPGSVMLVFERDAEAPAADTQGNSFMQEVMSYEHAVLTPAWVSTQVTYKRDPHEVKTWFMGGDQANLSARDTSQGTFLAYTSNASVQTSPGAAGKLGFVVMDFVLDLVSPNILPNKVNSLGIQQYVQVPNFGLQGINSVIMPQDTYQSQFYLTWGPVPGIGYVTGAGAGTILEVILDGNAGSNANNGQSISSWLATGVISTGSTTAIPTPSAATAFTQVLVSGSRLYLTAVRTWNNTGNSSSGTPGGGLYWLATATLADAIAVAGTNGGQTATYQNNTTTFQAMPCALQQRQGYSNTTTWSGWGANNIIAQQNAFVRVLSSPVGNSSTA